MQNPYSRYQKNQGMAQVPKKTKLDRPKASRPKRRKPIKKKGSGPQFNISLIALSIFGLLGSYYIFSYTDEVMDAVNRIEIGITRSLATDEKKAEKDSNKKDALPVGKATELKKADSQLTMKSTNVYKALKDKRRELEKKERRLAQLEEELQIQKQEVQKQLQEMQEMRRNIASKLDKKVVADQESIDKLVGVYSSMKPQNAALILTQLDDELAIQVLAKMKKQNAAAILNYVAPKKAQFLSEKFTGLKN